MASNQGSSREQGFSMPILSSDWSASDLDLYLPSVLVSVINITIFVLGWYTRTNAVVTVIDI